MPFYQVRPDRSPSGWRLFTLAGIPFTIAPSFLFFIGIILISEIESHMPIEQAGMIGFVIFFSLLAHEAGHALTARLFGYRDISVTLVMFGGATTHPSATRGHNLLITLAGPAVTIAIVFAGWMLVRLDPAFMSLPASRFLVREFMFLNLFWAIFNLLPIYPLDGGQALFFGLSYLLAWQRALLIVAFISVLLCAAGVGLSIMFHTGTFMLILLIMLGMQSLQILRSLKWS